MQETSGPSQLKAIHMSNDALDLYTNSMGDELGRFAFALGKEIANLSVSYTGYMQLYETNQSRRDLIDEAAPAFFGLVKYLIASELMLGLCRITDPAKTMGKCNLTVQALEALVETMLPGGSSVLKQPVDASKIATQFARDWRNRLYAHRDKGLSLNDGTSPLLAQANVKDIDVAISALNEVMMVLLTKFGWTSCDFRRVSGGIGAMGLLRVIDEGLQARNARTRRVESGTATVDDEKILEKFADPSW